MLRLFVGFFLVVSPIASAAEPEIGPMPREVVKLVQIEPISGGYQIKLSREGAVLLTDGLELLGDGKAISDFAKEVAAKRNDPALDKQIAFLTFVFKTQAPAIKKALAEKVGPNGAVIKVFGIEKQDGKFPLLRSAADAFLPADWKDLLKTGMTVVNTTPLWWRVEGRK